MLGTGWPQNADGTPHFTYYSKPDVVSFVWDGEQPWAQVCPGGYGEPSTDRLALRGWVKEFRRPSEALALFRDDCEAWLARQR